MNSEEFREFGKAVVDYIADYYDTIRDRDVLPSVEPGYLQPLIPNEAPQQGEKWQDIMKDLERVIMPGITHWHSPQFHAYFPAGNSFPSVVGELLCAGIGCIGFSWVQNIFKISSPACTELEVAMMNWLGKLINLPEEFLNCSEGPGGGIIQGSASESTLIALLAAKEKTVRLLMESDPNLTEDAIKARLVAYTSDEANSSVEKDGRLASISMKLLPTVKCSLQGETLQKAIEKDKRAGLIPCCVVATLGTTGTCALDNIEEIGAICNAENVWLHIDAAYVGTAFACPEYRYLMKGVELADTFNFNPHKWMLVNYDCSAMWMKDVNYLVEHFNVERIYLKHQHEAKTLDYRHWQIPLGRRFRSLKLWFVLRSYGVEGIRKHIRKHIALAEYFESLVRRDSRFEVCTSILGLVCFRLKGEEGLTKKLLEKVTARKMIYVIPCHYEKKFILRFAVCSRLTEVSDVNFAWNEIASQANEIVGSITNGISHYS